jgi:hypothetical protein
MVPTAVLELPVLVRSAAFPYAVLKLPGVLLVSAPVPPAVFPMLSLASLVGGRCAQLGATPSVSDRPTIAAATEQILCMKPLLLSAQ